MKRGMSANTIRNRIPQQTDDKTMESSSSTEKPSSAKGAIIFIIICIILSLYYAFIHSTNNIERTLHETSSVYKISHITINDADQDKAIEVEYMYEFPVGIMLNKAKGIIFLAHGCSHSATDFFDASKACPQCLGLPEEKALINALLNDKYIVISISSQNRDSKCWNKNRDTNPVKEVLLNFKKEYAIKLLPLFAFGASSGGTFVGSLATDINFVDAVGLDGVIVQISAINIGYDDLPFNIFVPVLFLPMSKDRRTAGIVKRELEILHKNGDTISDVCWIEESPIGELYFYRKIGGKITTQESKAIYKSLKDGKYLNDKDYLIEDPRRSQWRYIVRSALGWDRLNEIFDTMNPDESAISEEMNVAYAMHEFAAYCKPEMFKFMLAAQK